MGRAGAHSLHSLLTNLYRHHPNVPTKHSMVGGGERDRVHHCRKPNRYGLKNMKLAIYAVKWHGSKLFCDSLTTAKMAIRQKIKTKAMIPSPAV